jgi:hypothetical protein
MRIHFTHEYFVYIIFPILKTFYSLMKIFKMSSLVQTLMSFTVSSRTVASGLHFLSSLDRNPNAIKLNAVVCALHILSLLGRNTNAIKLNAVVCALHVLSLLSRNPCHNIVCSCLSASRFVLTRRKLHAIALNEAACALHVLSLLG